MTWFDRLMARFLFRRLDQETKRTAAELTERTNHCVAHARNSWRHFQTTFKFKENVTLADQIDIFAIPFETYVREKHPILMTRPGFFHLMLFTGILQAGTHPKDDVNAAVETLRSRYTD